MSVDPIIAARRFEANRARCRTTPFKAAGIANLQGGATSAVSRTLIGYHSSAPQHRTMYRDNRSTLPPSHFYAKHNPLLSGTDPRRPFSAPSSPPHQLRYEERLREQTTPSPPPRIRLNVTSVGTPSVDRPAGLPGPSAAMGIINACFGVSAGRGPSTPTNLVKMEGHYRCRVPFRGPPPATRPESAPVSQSLAPMKTPPMQPGVPRTSVPVGYAGYHSGICETAGYSKAAVLQNNSMWASPKRSWGSSSTQWVGRDLVIPPGSVQVRSRPQTASNNVSNNAQFGNNW